MDLITIIRKGLRIRYRSLSEKLNRSLNKLRYAIFLVFLGLPFLSGPIDPWLWPLGLFLWGPFRPIMVLLSPLEPLITPWDSLFKFQEIDFSYPYVTDIMVYFEGDYTLIIALIFVGLTILGSFFIRRFWCRFCPTGISLAIIHRIRGFGGIPLLHLRKEEEKCTKCNICKRVCPPQVTEVYEQKSGKIHTSICLMCMRCVEMCPYDSCLKVNFGGKTIFKSRNWLEPANE
jgi:Pyruvate/2-oxoacid:ferredoxin oxidoreductase delta subunit